MNDDVSHLLLLNRRNPNVESSIFAAELEKFKPYQQKLTTSIASHQSSITDLTQLWRALRDLAGRGDGARRWDERERRKADATRRFQRARDGYMEARDGAAKGMQFYAELSGLAASLKDNVKGFVGERGRERTAIIGQAEAKMRLSEPPKRPPPPPSSAAGLDRSFGSMGLGGGLHSPANWGQSTQSLPPPPPRPYASSPGQSSYPPPPGQSPYPPPPPTQTSPYSPPPPPSQPSHGQTQPSYTPSAPPRDPYASLGNMNFGSPTPPPPPPQQQQPQRQSTYPPPPGQGQGGYPGPPPAPSYQSYTSPPPQQQPQYTGQQPPQQQQSQQPQYTGQQPQQPQYTGYGTPSGIHDEI